MVQIYVLFYLVWIKFTWLYINEQYFTCVHYTTTYWKKLNKTWILELIKMNDTLSTLLKLIETTYLSLA